MPALSNPRYERFAQAIFAGLSGETRIARTQSTAYLTAYPNCSAGNSAEASASRLLRRVKPIIERVRELQAEANKRQQHKIDLSRERVGRRLDLASTMAEQQGNPSGIVNSELGIAKVFGHITDKTEVTSADFSQVKSMHDMGVKLLQSVGFASPDDVSIQAAIEANDAFVGRLEAIRDAAQRLTINQGTD